MSTKSLTKVALVLAIASFAAFLLLWVAPKLFQGASTVQKQVVAPAAQGAKEELNQVSPGVRKAMIAANENQYFRGLFVPSNGYENVKFVWVDRSANRAVMVGTWNVSSVEILSGVEGYVQVRISDDPDKMFVGPFSREMPE
jgi:hypothetical protein